MDKNILKKDQIPTNLNTKNQLKENYQQLIDCKVKYANNIGVDFKMFEYDEDYKKYKMGTKVFVRKRTRCRY